MRNGLLKGLVPYVFRLHLKACDHTNLNSLVWPLDEFQWFSQFKALVEIDSKWRSQRVLTLVHLQIFNIVKRKEI